jgi:multiple sugar transport system permease protein
VKTVKRDAAAPAAPMPLEARARRFSLSRMLPFWLMLPAMLIIAAIQLYPTLFTFVLSTQRIEAGVGRYLFVGIRNFQRLFDNSTFRESLFHTLFFLLGYAVLTMSVALALALLLKQRVALTPFYITLIFLPWVLSDVVVGAVWRLFVVPEYGLFSPFFANPSIFGPPNGISILTSTPRSTISPDVPFPPAPALLYLVVAAAWKILPFITLLLLAAMQTVPNEVLESASIDGASGAQRFRAITLPLILPTLTVALFNLTLGGVNGVGLVFSLTGGGPGTSTEVLSYLLYSIGFANLDFGLAAALSVIMGALNFVLIVFALRISRAQFEGV